MPVKARAGGQGRVRTGRVGAQQGTGGTPSPPTQDPSFGTASGIAIVSGVGGSGPSFGATAGAATVSGVGKGNALSLGSASGTATVSGVGDSSSSGFSAETTQFFDRLITMPSSSRQTTYSTLIDGLVSAGVWAKLDALFMYAAADAATSLTNLVQVSHGGFLDTGTGTPTFTADRGWSGNGAPGQRDVNMNFNPSTAAGHYTQNDAMFCAWQIGTTQENELFLADTLNDSKIELFPKWSDGNTYWAVNGTEITTTAPANSGGFWLGQRTASNASELRRNDVSVGTSASASTALSNSSIVLKPVANIVGCAGVGASLSSAQQTSLYNALNSYLTAIGAV